MEAIPQQHDIPEACPLCGAIGPSLRSRTHREAEVVYTLYECTACLVEFWWPLKNPGAEWYGHDDRYAGRNTDPGWGVTRNQKGTIAYLAPLRGSVLDVGCGIGNFLAYAAHAGWMCTGIDFDADAVAAGKKQFGLTELSVDDVVTYACTHPKKQFDLVTFFDVLEHIDNHNGFMGAVRDVVKPEGYIAMTMPYRKHATWLAPNDLPPRHLTRWDRASLRHFLELRGFKIIRLERQTEGLWHIVMKLRFRYGTWFSFGTVGAVRRTIEKGNDGPRNTSAAIRIVHILAKAKDLLLFGVPAVLIWLVMLPSARRYVTLYALARKKTP